VADYRASVPDIATALNLLLKDAGLRKRMGDAGRRRAVEHFDHRDVARRLVAILERQV
jgi:glycosyltransferase involved in cell wall biosynthesis